VDVRACTSHHIHQVDVSLHIYRVATGSHIQVALTSARVALRGLVAGFSAEEYAALSRTC
jgi:hypothetical protein